MTPNLFRQQILRLEHLQNLAQGRSYYYHKTNQRRNFEKEEAKIAELQEQIDSLKQIRL